MNDKVNDVCESADILQKTEKAQEGIKTLFELRLISLEDKKDLLNKVDQVKMDNFVFITKPFRRGESTEQYLHMLMKSRVSAFLKNMHEWNKHEN